MNPGQLRSMIRAPFHPFIVRTGSGVSYLVSHPELCWLDPDGEVVLVKDKKEVVVLIDIDSITECARPTKSKK
jgi:hypothetical protein